MTHNKYQTKVFHTQRMSDEKQAEYRWWGRLRNAAFVATLIVAVAGYLYLAALEGQALDMALQIGMK